MRSFSPSGAARERALVSFGGCAIAAVLLAASTAAGESAQPPRLLSEPGVPEPRAHPVGASVATAAGYGITEAILDRSDRHHRASGMVGLDYRPTRRLALGAAFDARYDRHRGEDLAEGGYVGEPRLLARAVAAREHALDFGLEASVRLPGGEAPSIVPSAASVEVRGLGAYAPEAWGRYAAYARAGGRFDRSAASAPDADRLGDAQRIALGVSESHALVFGGGLRRRGEAATLFAEWSWDLHVGAAAPAPTESPMRVGVGARGRAGDRYGWFGLARASLSARPSVARGDPLVPVEPRISAAFGVSYHFGGAGGDEAASGARAPGAIAGALEMDDPEVGGGRVRVRAAGEELEIEPGPDGSFRAADIPAGEVRLRASAPEHESREVRTRVAAGETAEVAIELEREAPSGEIQGRVRSFVGEPVPADVEIEPGGVSLEADAEGRFSAEVEPGSYTISIAAPGHRDQERRIRVKRRGVTVLNIDLRRED